MLCRNQEKGAPGRTEPEDHGLGRSRGGLSSDGSESPKPQITQVWADRGYAGALADWARERLWLTLHIASKPKGTKGFVVLPRHWKVERTIGWCMNARRNARGYERPPQHSEPT